MWTAPCPEDLAALLGDAHSHLLVCSPWISARGVRLLRQNVQPDIECIEIWCRLKTVDWIQGRSDYPELLDFVDGLPKPKAISLLTHDRLHAKFYIADHVRALGGSANLTHGGLELNFEIWSDDDVASLRGVAATMEGHLRKVDLADFRQFVATCEGLRGERTRFLESIAETQGAYPGPGEELVPLERFIAHCRELERRADPLATKVIDWYDNRAGENVQGHIKQAYYAAQRFLREAPEHIATLQALPEGIAYELQSSSMLGDWEAFLDLYGDDEEPSYGFDMRILQHYLPVNLGGTQKTGGGGGYKLKVALPLVASTRLTNSAV